MSLRFYDTASAEVRDFVPLQAGKVGLYYCGATVQGDPHVGHIRSGIAFDQLTRWLRYSGYEVTVVRNVTDIDDKILAKSAASYLPEGLEDPLAVPNEPWWALAYRYEQAFERAYDILGVQRPTYEPRATGHIPEMHQLIALLIDRGHAYPALDGSGDVYFDVRSWSEYGSLTRQKIEDMQAAPDAGPRGKKDPRDFALWKGYKEGEPATASWPSPWGTGRPGWHLECSAMVTKYLGPEFDIHGGGLDLRFPHHENEMAQSRAAGHGFANFWMHNGMVTYEGEKMSKSVGNIVTPTEMLELARPVVVRYYLGQAQYRSALDYNPGSLTEAAAAVERIEGFLQRALKFLYGEDFGFVDSDVPAAFRAAMDDDLNVPQALAVIHETVRAGNTALDGKDSEGIERALHQVLAMTDVLFINPLDPHWNTGGTDIAARQALDTLVKAQLEERRAAREAKDWARADAIRDTLAAAGVVVEDSADGPTWTVAAR
ncbi:cysteine--tRNA ligase [Arthrobacter crystallopoietes]|uniref:Cysteine--tRNA ligase n=1 Tax=Crystallibacter crystallopoietes TaxID=37928 RepID=A0A1H1BG81_9MICC|nr:cysteine--tRNA ligase [Arthrobacter crystallopoietes]AUI51153.1 cysteine--tRNA ligase [Arthrobacter crystallopoietes]SDQ50968.1 cysteinyl-tRNA synthetase [Arthrobacter crystallopoietes]